MLPSIWNIWNRASAAGDARGSLAATIPARFRGLPQIDAERCDGCCDCERACPTQAISLSSAANAANDMELSVSTIDLGRCLFCGDCESACSERAVHFTTNPQLAASQRVGLMRGPESNPPRVESMSPGESRFFGRSLALFLVPAGDCDGCSNEFHALRDAVFGLERYGISIVDSPLQADALVLTGPVTRLTEPLLRAAWEAMLAPKFLIAVGACAISGGPFRDLPETRNGVPRDLPVSLYLPGCPPHPLTLLDGLARWLNQPSPVAKLPSPTV